MRQVVLQMSMTTDGYVTSERAHPGASVPESEELVQWKLDRIQRAGAHLMGRVTYEEMAGFWPTSRDRYAAPMNEIPKVVFSSTLSEAQASWPKTTIARGDLADEIATIKGAEGPDVIAWGGGRLAGALVARGLIDEYRLAVQPLVVGQGQALFEHVPAARRLELVEATSFPCGIVMHVLRPTHS